MDKVLRSHLRTLFDRFQTTSKMSAATTAARAAGDWRFFDRLGDSKKTFTVKKYEEIVCWFSKNWPEALSWPTEVPRPLHQASDQAASHAA